MTDLSSSRADRVWTLPCPHRRHAFDAIVQLRIALRWIAAMRRVDGFAVEKTVRIHSPE